MISDDEEGGTVRTAMTICLEAILLYSCVCRSEVLGHSQARPRMQLIYAQKQEDVSAYPIFNPQHPINCEDFQAYLDDAIVRWQKLKGTYFIVIVRVGAGERSTLNGFRLAYIEEYLKRHGVEYIYAQGSRVKGLARMEFYVAGKFITVIPIKRNAKRVCSGLNGD